MVSVAWLLPVLLLTGQPPAAAPVTQAVQRLYFRRAGAVVVYELGAPHERVLWPEREPGNDEPPVASADGQSVYFTLQRSLWCLPASGGQPRRLTLLGGAREADDVCDLPCPSPDGRWLAYRCRLGGGQPTLRLLRLDQSADRHVADGLVGAPSWSPASDKLAFAAGGRLYTCGAEQGRPVALTAGPGDVAPNWLAPGRLLFNRGTTPLWVTPAGAVSAATPHGFDAGQVFVSTDGVRLALARTVLDPRSPQRCWTELHVVEGEAVRSRLVLSTYAPTHVNGRARLLGWRDTQHMLVLRDLGEPCRKVYAVDVSTSRGELVFKAQQLDDGFSLWPSGGSQ